MSLYIGNMGLQELKELRDQWAIHGKNPDRRKVIRNIDLRMAELSNATRSCLPKKKQRELGMIPPVALFVLALLLGFASRADTNGVPKFPTNAPAPVYGLQNPLPGAAAADLWWSQHAYTNAGTNVPVVRISQIATGVDWVHLAWNAESDATVVGYALYLTTNAANWVVSPVETGTNTDVVVSNLTGGMTYYAAVAAYDGADNYSSNCTPVSYLARHAVQVLVSNQVSWLDACSPTNSIHWFSNGPQTVMVRFVNYPGASLMGSTNLTFWQAVGQWVASSNSWQCVTDSVLPNKFYRIP